MSADIKVTGLEELEKKLLNMPKVVAKKVVRVAARDTAKKTALIRVKHRSLHMVGGKLGKFMAKAGMFTVRAFKKQKKGSFGVYVGFSKKASIVSELIHISKTGKRSFIPNAVEFGHGNAKPIPFMRLAYAESVANGKIMFKKLLEDGAEKAFKSL